jgi:putative tricarboxylic transport membrane protein
MKRNADRASGLFFLLSGLALYLFIIPAYVEQAEGGWVHPDTIPNAVAIVLALGGAALALRPSRHQIQEASEFARAGLYFALLMAGLLLMGQFGFVYVAPPLALAVMLMIGERRPLWLIAGAAAMPAAIWLLVVQVLDRALP